MDTNIHPLNHVRVIRALDALDRDKTYVPRVKLPITPSAFYNILSSLQNNPTGNLLRAALLTLYYGALRQSELFPHSIAKWDPYTQPTRGDMSITNTQCAIFIKKAKNMQKYGQNRKVLMDIAPNSIVCPVRAMSRMCNDSPTQSLNDPLFMFHDSRLPVPASFILAQLHALMRLGGLEPDIPHTSLHSIRKSAATDAFMAGHSENSIKNYGGWSSSAYRVYIRTSNREVNQSLIRTIDQSHNH